MTNVEFYTQPTNLDSLIAPLRIRFGDIDGSTFSDTVMRTAIIYGIQYIAPRWDYKYNIFDSSLITNDTAPDGMISIGTPHGIMYVPDTLKRGDIFKSTYFEWNTSLLIDPNDVPIIISAAVYMLRRLQLSGGVQSFVSWSTEDIRYSTLEQSRVLKDMLTQDLNELNNFFAKGIGLVRVSSMPFQ